MTTVHAPRTLVVLTEAAGKQKEGKFVSFFEKPCAALQILSASTPYVQKYVVFINQ